MNKEEIEEARRCARALSTNHDVDINTLCFYMDKVLDKFEVYREALESIELYGNLKATAIASTALSDERI
jgi:hypothetical protein